MSSPNGSDDDNFLTRHWPFFVTALTVIVLALFYINLGAAAATSLEGLLIAVLPNLIASLVVAATLYVLLRRDVRSIAGGTGSGEDLGVRRQLDVISQAISDLTAGTTSVRSRSDLPDLRDALDSALSVDIVATSAAGLINRHRGLIEKQLKEGKNFRVVLLDAREAESMQVWDRLSNPPMNTPEEDIRAGLAQFQSLARLQELRGRCDVRVIGTVLPWSMIRVIGEAKSSVQVEIYAFHKAPEARLNLIFDSDRDRDWYEFFSEQFDLVWQASVAAP